MRRCQGQRVPGIADNLLPVDFLTFCHEGSLEFVCERDLLVSFDHTTHTYIFRGSMKSAFWAGWLVTNSAIAKCGLPVSCFLYPKIVIVWVKNMQKVKRKGKFTILSF